MKKRAIFRNGPAKLPITERLRDIWKKILSDRDAREALKRLDEAGFPISHLQPSDGSFKQPCWADYIAGIPLVPNKPTTRRIHRKTKFRKHLSLVRELRALGVNDSFKQVTLVSERDYPTSSICSFGADLLKAASVLEYLFSCDYVVRRVNPRNALIAGLRWTIRYRTGRPHDRELSVLIDAAFRAAGFATGCYLDAITLDRIEKRQKESRVKAHRKMRMR